MKHSLPPAIPPIVHQDLSATQQCVMCGMCVPHCPTYALSQNEADGPRGRIALMLGMAQERLELDSKVIEHLDACLSCRACEQVCPSKVPYGQLIDAGRAHINVRVNGRAPARSRWMRIVRDQVLLRPTRLRVLGGLTRVMQRLRLDRLPMPSSLKRLTQLAPPLAPAFRPLEIYPVSHPRGRVGLFLGCMGSVFEAENLRAAIVVLNAWGYEVRVPRKQGCCGAMHQHGGDPQRGQAMAAKVAQLFQALELDAVVGASSGCIAQLKEHAGMKAGIKAFELSDFLWQQQPAPLPAMQPLPRRVAVHLPCTQRNVLRTGNSAMKLLSLIPALEVIELAGNERCCGAAGTHMLTHPTQADALSAPKIEAFRALGAAQMVSTNIGCAMHLGAGLRKAEATAEVIHPVRLLAEALKAC
ncbi:MAG: (Fe-S)-binding protein [Halothiobacillaceae bacterium]|nr:(Fe-S)-binding protein [Halothiobacillaceae bacterium]